MKDSNFFQIITIFLIIVVGIMIGKIDLLVKEADEQKAYIEYLEDHFDERVRGNVGDELLNAFVCEYPNNPDSADVFAHMEAAGSWYPSIDERFARILTDNYSSKRFLRTGDCFPGIHNGGPCFAAMWSHDTMFYRNYAVSCCEHVYYMKYLFGNEDPGEEKYEKTIESLINNKKIKTMGYTLVGHFVDVQNKKEIASAYLDFMKNLNEVRYSCEFEHVFSSSNIRSDEYPDVTSYKSMEMFGYYKSDVLNDPDLKDAISEHNSNFNKNTYGRDFEYEVDEAFFEKNKDKFQKYEIPVFELKDNETYVTLGCMTTEQRNGIWYTAADFENAATAYLKEYDKATERFNKLNTLNNTKDYFEMSENAKNEFLSELSFAEEAVSDAKCRYECICKMNNIMDFMSSDFIIHDSYYGMRDIEVFVECS